MAKNVLIIGGSSGLGKRLAEIYVAEGCQVGLMARRQDLLLEIQQQFPSQIHIAAADISQGPIEGKIMELVDRMNGIDLMIISASIAEFNEELLPAIEISTIETNVKGYAQALLTGYHYFRKKGSGQIAGITSIAAARGNKMAPAYNASKAFQSNYLEGLRLRAKHEKSGICVTELVPGYINTGMGKGKRLFWVASVEKAARQSKRAIDKKRKKVFITKRWWLVYRVLRFLPIFIYDPLMNGSWKLKQKT